MTTKSRIKSGSKADSKPHLVAFHELFHFANRSDYVLIFVGLVMTLLKALVHPFAIVAYSELVAMLIERNQSTGTSTETYALPLFGGGKLLINATHEENMAELKKDSISFGILITLDSLLLFISGTVYADIFNHVALQQVLRMRRKFFESTVRQDLTWHDLAQDQNFAVYITDNMEKIRNGIAENVGHFLQLVIDVVICVIVSFVYGWKLTLALFIYLPITVAINVTVAKYQSKLTTREQNSYARAGSVAEEVIGAIRTVVAFGGEEKESQRYDERLVPACKAGKIKGAFSGLSDSVLKSMVFICSAGAFWYGVHLVLEDREKEDTEKEYTPAVLIIVVSSIVVGADHLARVTPFLESFAMARGSAAPIFDAIDAKSRIDPSSKDGKILNYGLRGSIEFKDVFFSYPSRSDAIVLRGVSLCVGAGQTVALVGYSGSGKSTCVQLLQRFYDPMFGRILLDGLDIRQYNVQWLRSNIAVVGQEPVLFQGTIAQNIHYGKRNATRKEVEDAAREAGAHDFIIALPNSYDTQISEKGTQLSGGQRQRIAIARAFIQNPKILLLDEATSALDYHSEKLVQEALDRASVGRTTIVVSHRLSAIRQADYIIFMDKGKVVEQGNHEELMLHAGKYYQMVTAHQYEDNFDDKLEDLEPLDKSTPQAQDAGDKGTSELSIKLRSSLDAKSSVASSDIKNFVMAKTAAAEEKERRKQTIYSKTFLRLMRSARPEWTYLTVGAVCAAIYGCTQPAFAIVCSEFYAALAQEDPETVLDRTALISIISVVIGISVGVACYTQTYLFNLAGVWLTTRMRSIIFKTIMKQEMAWFDEEENSVGALSARLSGDASSLQGAIGFPLSSIIQAITNFVCGVSIAFSYSWELALICLCTSPFMVASVVFEARFVAKAAVREKEVLEETSRIATEAIAQIRTVASLCREPWLIEEYNEETERYRVEIKKRLRFRGIVNNLGMAIMFFGYAVTLAYGGIMCAEGRIKFQDIMKISSTLLYGLFILAQSLTSTPAFNAALISGHRLYQIIDRQPRITSSNVYETLRVLPRTNTYPRSVSYHSLHFRYPTRPEQRVLCGLNLDVSQGKTVALVGASGCGKSTCIQLLQRFYDPDSGNIFIDQRNINRDMELPALRRRLGIVSQEPSLFDKTIAENIAYGDTSRAVPMTEIVEAAKMANAHDFIAALPLGYDTSLGARGTQLSGGQKQRIAIARALVRNPKILLLDEATSALDLQSERLVQSALDVACSGRTCIVIAHRLSTVQNADVICVLQNGRIVEQGSHSQLLATNGVYAKLYRSQPNIK